MAQLEDTLEEITRIRRTIKANINNPSALSTLAVDAATHLSYLGDSLAEAKVQYDSERAKAYLDYMEKKDSNDRADNLSKADTVALKNKVTQLEMIHKDMQRVVSVIQTKVRTLESEAKGQF